MSQILTERLRRLEATHRVSPAQSRERMPVFYGWAKLNKVMKREALMVIFLNDNPGPRINKDGKYGVTKYMNVVYERCQTSKEEADAKFNNRLYSVYNIFMDDRNVRGSLEAALKINNDADKNNVTQSERDAIRKALYDAYVECHRGYKEPTRQMEINFE